MKMPACKLKKVLFACLVVVAVSISSVASAYAVDVFDILKWGLSPVTVNQGEDEWVTMRNQVNALWQSYSNCSDMAKYPISYDALSNLVADLNGSGFPCYLQYSRGLGVYVIIGSGPVTGLTGVSIVDKYLTNGQRGLFCAEYNTDSLLSSISTKVTTISNTLTNKLTTVISSLGTLDERLSTISSTLSRLLSRTLRTTSDGTEYTLADLNYYTWQQTKNVVSGVSSVGKKLDTLSSGVDTLAGKLDTLAGLISPNTYTCGYRSDDSGTDFPTQSIPYDMAVQCVARINSELLGRSMTVLKRDGSGTLSVTIDRCMIDAGGYIFVCSGSYSYYLCGRDNTIFVAGQDYDKSIYSRLTDVIAAVNSLTVGIDLSDVQLSVDASSIQTFNNSAYCCGYLSDAEGNAYATLPIPYASAAAIVERLNTDYVDRKITTVARSGALSSGYLRSASLTASGYIRVSLANGYTYYLCDKANVLYLADASSNYGSRATDSLLGISARLDTILESLQAAPGSGSCQHSYRQEMTQEASCTLPGLLVCTCTLCGDSYSEIVSPLGHDWVCTEHQEETETESGYDIYICQRCGSSYHDYSGSGAPEDYSETSISKLLVLLFSRLGSFAGKLLSFVIGLFDRALGSVDRVVGSFNELAGQISGFGGEYPTWLSGFWDILPQELQLALTFAFVCMVMGVVGRKLVFS